MKSRIFSIILSVVLLSQISFAKICAVLKDVHAGEIHTLVIDDSNCLWACGGGYLLGLGDVSGNVLWLQQVHGPNGIGNLKHIVSFDAGYQHSLAADSNGNCWSFGCDASGQLGNGPGEQDSDVPIKVHGLNNDSYGLRHIVKVSAGRSGEHSLAVDSNGYVYAWGLNDYGQCGNNESGNSKPSPVLVVGSDPNRHLGDEAFIVDVEAGEKHSLALVKFEDGGFVYEWGGYYPNYYLYPHKVSGPNGGYLRNIKDIAVCDDSLAADSNGNVWQWTTGTTNPTKISGGGMGNVVIVKVAAGGGICAALDANGNVWEWSGSGGTPVKVSCGQMPSKSGYLENIVAIDVGYYDHRVAIDKYGRGWAWAEDEASCNHGQLGVLDISGHPKPTMMFGPLLSEPNVRNITKDINYPSIGAAISGAYSDRINEIVVYPGVYKENVNFGSKQITLRSLDPNNPFIVEHTVILGVGYPSDAVTVANNSTNSTIDGFTIVGGRDGISCSNANLTVSRCRIRNTYSIGIYVASGSAAIINNIISNNRDDGIYLYNCSSSPEIKIRNNTIVDNGYYGIYRETGGDPNIINNIIYGNTSGGLYGSTFTKVTYNCIQGGYSGNGNINSKPLFKDANSNDFHLTVNSPCKNAGNPNFTSSTETDIDGEARINDGRVDIGADEFYPCTDKDVFPLPPNGPDGIVNFQDFAVLANAWMTSSGSNNYNDAVDFVDVGVINKKDLKEFCDCWLYTIADYESRIESQGEESMMSMPPEQESSMQTESQPEQMMAESQQEESQQQSEQQLYMPDYNLPAIYLTCDDNTPEPNDEVTIQVHSVAPLFAMGMGIYIIGDANITTAMNEADCNSFGWDNGWNSDPYIDPNGWVYLGGVKWASDANGTVGYVKFRYHSGQVSVYIDQENSLAFEWNGGESCPIVPFSQEAILIARDPNEP